MIIAEPLPECYLCETPTLRTAWEANGGICTPCREGIADTVKMLRPVGGDDLTSRARRDALLVRQAEIVDDSTVYVERYIPPVPGQLELCGDDPAGWCVNPSHGHYFAGRDPE